MALLKHAGDCVRTWLRPVCRQRSSALFQQRLAPFPLGFSCFGSFNDIVMQQNAIQRVMVVFLRILDRMFVMAVSCARICVVRYQQLHAIFQSKLGTRM
jgi:hypothetical protein